MRQSYRYDKPFSKMAFYALDHISVLVFVVAFTGCTESGNTVHTVTIDDSSLTYYCPMHPEIQQNRPGKCPEPSCMGMDLVLKMSDTLLENVLKPVNDAVLASVGVTKPVYMEMPMDVLANGYIEYDDRSKKNISSLVSGRIEKLYVKYNFHPVYAGQKIFEIYSPELVLAQENLIYLLVNDPEEITLIESARQKLKLLGFTDKLIQEIITAREALLTVPVYSKYNGHLLEMKSSAEMKSMPSEQDNTGSDRQLSVKQGQYVMMGETIFNVVSDKHLAVVLQIKSEDIAKVYKGAEVDIEVDGGGTICGTIDFIEPMLRPDAKTIAVKMYFENNETNHKVGALVKSRIKCESFETLWVPLSSVIDLGRGKIVWVKKNGNFVAKKIETGIRSGNMIEIADGLTEDSEIAVEAHFLTDSEGFIKAGEDDL